MDADYQALLLHLEIWWLSWGRVLKRACDLRGEFDFMNCLKLYARDWFYSN